MTTKREDREQPIKKTKKIILVIVLPLLLVFTGLTAISSWSTEKPTKIEILEEINLHCYNVNWFGTQGFQITYKDSMKEIAYKLDEYDYDFKPQEFFKDQQVIDYLVIHCPHIDNTINAPDEFDPNYGVSALDKCLQVKEGTVNSEEYCLQFKS